MVRIVCAARTPYSRLPGTVMIKTQDLYPKLSVCTRWEGRIKKKQSCETAGKYEPLDSVF